jgi:hypothetical protein
VVPGALRRGSGLNSGQLLAESVATSSWSGRRSASGGLRGLLVFPTKHDASSGRDGRARALRPPGWRPLARAIPERPTPAGKLGPRRRDPHRGSVLRPPGRMPGNWPQKRGGSAPPPRTPRGCLRGPPRKDPAAATPGSEAAYARPSVRSWAAVIEVRRRMPDRCRWRRAAAKEGAGKLRGATQTWRQGILQRRGGGRRVMRHKPTGLPI